MNHYAPTAPTRAPYHPWARFKEEVRRARITQFFAEPVPAGCAYARAEFDDWGNITYWECGNDEDRDELDRRGRWDDEAHS